MIDISYLAGLLEDKGSRLKVDLLHLRSVKLDAGRKLMRLGRRGIDDREWMG